MVQVGGEQVTLAAVDWIAWTSGPQAPPTSVASTLTEFWSVAAAHVASSLARRLMTCDAPRARLLNVHCRLRESPVETGMEGTLLSLTYESPGSRMSLTVIDSRPQSPSLSTVMVQSTACPGQALWLAGVLVTLTDGGIRREKGGAERSSANPSCWALAVRMMFALQRSVPAGTTFWKLSTRSSRKPLFLANAD